MVWRSFGAISLAALPVSAQETSAPLSAIDWLSRSVASETVAISPATNGEAPVAQSGSSPNVTTTVLDQATFDRVGLLSPAVTGLPRTLWSASQTDVLVDLLAAIEVESLPAVEDLLMTLLLAEADPPLGATGEARFFMARVDKLLDIGALAPAQALVEAAGPATPALYRRWFDISLLTGTEDDACEAQAVQPALETTYPARIFCLARNGDWTAAALTLNTARALGDISLEEEALLSRFLDPELYEGEPDLPPPSRPSPLVFRMREAIGQPLPSASLPRAFANADLRTTVAWRYHIAAAERLIRTGAVADNVLFGHYVADTPSASGGVWDRARDIQAFEAALSSAGPEEIGAALIAAWAVAEAIGAEVPFARYYGDRLLDVDLTGRAARLAFQLGLLTQQYAQVADRMAPVTGQERLWQAVATGELDQMIGRDSAEQAVVSGLTTAVPPSVIGNMIDQGRTGEAILRVIALITQGRSGDDAAIAEGLASLRAIGMDEVATQVALQFLILDRGS